MPDISPLYVLARSYEQEMQNIFYYFSMGALALMVLGIALYGLYKLAKPVLDKIKRKQYISAALVSSFVVVLVLFAGQGTGWGFTFIKSSGLTDAGSAANLETGDVVARWTYIPAVADYDFKWYYTLKYENDKEKRGPFQLPDAKVSDGYASAKIPESGFKALDITCYTTYVPPPQVVTNVVYHLSGIMRSMDSVDADDPIFVTPGITVDVMDERGYMHKLAPYDAKYIEVLDSLEKKMYLEEVLNSLTK